MRRRSISLVLLSLATALALCLCACGGSAQNTSGPSSSSAGGAAAHNGGTHIIGVAVYDIADNEVRMFQQYLADYIAKTCFDDVQFVYSNSIATENEMLDFIDSIADMGGEGIMSFFNLDLKGEVERCASHGMYHIVASGTVSEEDFESVADNEFFLGQVGPMIQMEYNAGAAMARNFIAHKAGDRYFVLSGGAPLGNEMHYQRTLGILDTLETSYGVDLGHTDELAGVDEVTTITVEDLTVTLSPGYISYDEAGKAAEDAFKAGSFDVVLSTLPVSPIYDTLRTGNAKIAQVDCYSQDNQLLFATGQLDYLAGKYGSMVGPSFVALYNAITGHAQAFRDNGKAFKIVQNFWTSDSDADFEKKFQLASNMTTPAYNYEDLYSICCTHTPNATLDDLRSLAEKCSYEDGLQRRGTS